MPTTLDKAPDIRSMRANRSPVPVEFRASEMESAKANTAKPAIESNPRYNRGEMRFEVHGSSKIKAGRAQSTPNLRCLFLEMPRQCRTPRGQRGWNLLRK